MQYPVLYSFRRCPYAIRARMALYYAGICCELREVRLKYKPPEMLALSGKGTVPVLQVDDVVIDESLEVMRWALSRSDPDGWLSGDGDGLLNRNDGYFKDCLDHYKYFERHPEHSQQAYFEQAAVFLKELEACLVRNNEFKNTENDTPESGPVFLLSPRMSLIDIAIFPFVRQFAAVDRVRFDSLGLPKLVYWLDYFLTSPLFAAVMQKYPVWNSAISEPLLFARQVDRYQQG